MTDSNARTNTLIAITDFGVHFKIFLCSGTSLVSSSLVPYVLSVIYISCDDSLMFYVTLKQLTKYFDPPQEQRVGVCKTSLTPPFLPQSIILLIVLGDTSVVVL